MKMKVVLQSSGVENTICIEAPKSRPILNVSPDFAPIYIFTGLGVLGCGIPLLYYFKKRYKLTSIKIMKESCLSAFNLS